MKAVCCRAGCEYKLHVELAHIKAINSFSPKTTIGEINSLHNLTFLCRNCHWELDNNYITPKNLRTLAYLSGAGVTAAHLASTQEAGAHIPCPAPGLL